MSRTPTEEQKRKYPRLAEYGDVQRTGAPRSQVTVLAEAPGRFHRAPMVALVRATAGYEPAGSMMRWTDGFVAVWWDSCGARQGRRYLPESEDKARAHFVSLTKHDDGEEAA